MPRYFFESDDGTHSTTGDWVQLADATAARRAALDSLPDMARETMPDGDRRVMKVVATDEAGAVVYSATLTLEGEWGAPNVGAGRGGNTVTANPHRA